MKFDTNEAFISHRADTKHLNLLKILRKTKFKVRMPPKLRELKREELIICPDLNDCGYSTRDSYENFCKYPHYPVEIHEWQKFLECFEASKINSAFSIHPEKIENYLYISHTDRLKKIISSYADEEVIFPKLNDLISNHCKIEECTYDTLWHQFITKEMTTCIQLVEK